MKVYLELDVNELTEIQYCLDTVDANRKKARAHHDKTRTDASAPQKTNKRKDIPILRPMTEQELKAKVGTDDYLKKMSRLLTLINELPPGETKDKLLLGFYGADTLRA